MLTSEDVTTRGNYWPDKSMATAAVDAPLFLLENHTHSVQNPPLYLHVTSTSKQGLEKAVAKIQELMQQELPNLVDERRFRRREPEQVERDEFGRVSTNLELEGHLLTGISVNGLKRRFPLTLNPYKDLIFEPKWLAMVVSMLNTSNKKPDAVSRSRGVALVSWSMERVRRAMSPCIFMLRRSSIARLLINADLNRGPDPNEVQKAKELCEDLLKNVREQYEEFKSRPQPSRGYGGNTGYGGERGYGDRAPDRSNSYSGGGNSGGSYGGGYNNSPAAHSTSAMSPTTPSAPGAGSPAASADYAAQYAQYYAAQGQGGADPYAAYGGYAAYVQYYQAYMAQVAAQQQGAPGAAPGAPGSAPPPPPSEAPPPPPPSGPAPGYNAVSHEI